MSSVPSPMLDIATLRSLLGPNSTWAIEAGRKVEQLRTDLGYSHEVLAVAVGCTTQTIRQIEGGRLVPRDYLRAAIAFALGKDPSDIWPPFSRRHIGEVAAA